MKTLKIILCLFLLPSLGIGQKDKRVDLKWKIGENEILTYEVIFSELDPANIKFYSDEKTDVLFEKLMKMAMKKVKNSQEDVETVFELAKKEDGAIQVVNERRLRETTKFSEDDETENELEMFLLKSSLGVVFTGSIYESGEIQSKDLLPRKKNGLALFFQLPAHEVKIGDSWDLDVSIMQMGASFELDSTYKSNKASLIDLKRKKGETLAVIKYKAEEYIRGQTSYKDFDGTKKYNDMESHMVYYAIAEFSIENGRWHSYESILETRVRGEMNIDVLQRSSLVEK